MLDTVDDGRCGIGILLQTPDGIHWLYCHLSQRDPAVLPGAVLSAGQWVGLVGSTGDATGPHLHLALKPETSYPQEMTWFQEFAGTAFAWQDAPTRRPDPFRGSPVFAVVPSVRCRRRGGRVHDCPFKGLSFMPLPAEKVPMTAGLFARAPRLAVLVAVAAAR